MVICKLHSVKSGANTIGCDVDSYLKVAQDHHGSRPVDKSNPNLMKVDYDQKKDHIYTKPGLQITPKYPLNI